MLKTYIVYFKYKYPEDKKPGAIKHFRIYATNPEEARRMAMSHANYPNVEVLRVKGV